MVFVPGFPVRTIALDARQRRLLDVTELAARLATAARVPGRALAVRLLAELGRDGSDSMFESLVRERLRAAGLHPSDAPVPVRTVDGRIVHLDIAFPDERVAIECQGFVAHHSRRQLDRDARRDNSVLPAPPAITAEAQERGRPSPERGLPRTGCESRT